MDHSVRIDCDDVRAAGAVDGNTAAVAGDQPPTGSSGLDDGVARSAGPGGAGSADDGAGGVEGPEMVDLKPFYFVIKVPEWLRKFGPNESQSLKLSVHDSVGVVRSLMTGMPEFSPVTNFDLVLERSGVVLAATAELADVMQALPGEFEVAAGPATTTSPGDKTAVSADEPPADDCLPSLSVLVVPRPYSMVQAKQHLASLLRLLTPARPPADSPCVAHELARCHALTPELLADDNSTASISNDSSPSVSRQQPREPLDDGLELDVWGLADGGRPAPAPAARAKGAAGHRRSEPMYNVPSVADFSVSGRTARLAGLLLPGQDPGAGPFPSTVATDVLRVPSGAPFAHARKELPLQGAVRQLAYSAWNPPTAPRRLAGDLFYLTVVTAEGQTHELTASVAGWFVNGSSRRQFVAEARGAVNHTLAGLLQRLSGRFLERYARAWRQRDELLDALIRGPLPQSQAPAARWLEPVSPNEPRARDPARAAHWLAHGCLGHVGAALSGAPDVQHSSVGPVDQLERQLHAAADCACGAQAAQLAASAGGDWNAQDLASAEFGSVDASAGGSASRMLPPRDWHDEFNSYSEQVSDNSRLQAERVRILSHVYAAFVSAARSVALDVARGNLPAINPLDTQSNQVFYHAGVMVSYAGRGSNYVGVTGADRSVPPVPAVDPPLPVLQRVAQANEVASARSLNEMMVGWKCVANDIGAIQRLLDVDVPGLSYILLCAFDVCGWRMLAQSAIPGVLRKQESMIRCGSLDFGQTLLQDAQFDELAGRLADSLQLARHSVADASGATVVEVRLPVETKGVRALDGRCLFVDWFRSAPVDANYVDAEGVSPALAMSCLVRPELLSIHTHLLVQSMLRREQQQQKQIAAPTGVQPAAVPDDDPGQLAQKRSLPNGEQNGSGTESSAGADREDATLDVAARVSDERLRAVYQSEEFQAKNQFCVNALTPHRVQYASPEEREAMEAPIKQLAVLLRGRQLSTLAQNIGSSGALVPLDGDELVEVMHRHGVNTRYLGALARHWTPGSELHVLIARAMVVRAAKALLWARLRARQPRGLLSTGVPDTVAEFLTALTAKPPAGTAAAAPNSAKSAPAPATVAALAANAKSLDAALCWRGVFAELDRRFVGHGLSLAEDPGRVLGSALLREFCRQTGIVLTTAAAGRVLPASFAAQDVVSLEPRVKRLELKAKRAADLLEQARALFRRTPSDTEDLKAAFELSSRAQVFLEQVHGPLHPDMVDLLDLRASLLRLFGHPVLAAQHRVKATIISERVNGLDHHRTLLAYMALVPALCDAGGRLAALRCSERLMRLVRLVQAPAAYRARCASVHASALVHCGYPELAVRYVEVSAAHQAATAGAPGAVLAQRRLAEAHLAAHDGRAAVRHARHHLQVLRDNARPTGDPASAQYMQEAAALLESCVSSAVAWAQTPPPALAHAPARADKPEKQQRQARQKKKPAAAGQAGGDAPATRDFRDKSIDEILKFVEPRKANTKKKRAGAVRRK